MVTRQRPVLREPDPQSDEPAQEPAIAGTVVSRNGSAQASHISTSRPQSFAIASPACDPGPDGSVVAENRVIAKVMKSRSCHTVPLPPASRSNSSGWSLKPRANWQRSYRCATTSRPRPIVAATRTTAAITLLPTMLRYGTVYKHNFHSSHLSARSGSGRGRTPAGVAGAFALGAAYGAA